MRKVSSSPRVTSPHLVELGKFLMARRAEVTPFQVGLPDAGKRRTPGLRREEVALLAGVGVSWYTWIEQGRAENVSGEVLDSVARVLQLNDNQRVYLRHLAGIQANYPLPESAPASVELQPFVENWLPNPAYISDHRWNIIVANDAAQVLLGIEDGPYNVLREFFLSGRVRESYPRWEEDAPSVVARFRSQAGQHADDTGIQDLVDELSEASGFFAELWDRHEVIEDSCGPEFLHHPGVGELHFTRATLDFTPRIAVRMTVFLPAPGTGTESAVRRISHLGLGARLRLLREAQ
ncbi:helix-turn-helix transcriptional regulator [Streptomyces sp. NPDC054956]